VIVIDFALQGHCHLCLARSSNLFHQQSTTVLQGIHYLISLVYGTKQSWYCI
jgi:hypothetical protein